MRRVLYSLVILGILLAVSLLSLWDMEHTVRDISDEIAALRSQTGQLAPDELVLRCRALQQQWAVIERRFMLYVPHSRLDSIAEHLAELSACAEQEDPAGLFCSLDIARTMMHRLLNSVLPSRQTLL